LDRKLLAELWLIMSGLFAHKWTSTYGEWDDDNSNIAIWGSALRGVTDKQFKHGLVTVSDSGEKWPPGAPEFKLLCRGHKEHPEHAKIRIATEEFDANQKRLSHETHTPEVGNKAIKEIFKMLRK
jgi:hypothetical protein